MLTIAAFVLALAVLVAVHEWGHYRVAVACGVGVSRFSLGLGPVVWRWRPRRQRPGQDTEFVVSLFPLGGYVRMLDEREAPVAALRRHQAFNLQPLRARAAIVAAGPAANFLLAIVLYTLVHMFGVERAAAVLSEPLPASWAAKAGLHSGDQVLAVAPEGRDWEPVRSYEELRWHLTQAALDGENLQLKVQEPRQGDLRLHVLPLAQFGSGGDIDADFWRRLGLNGPRTAPVLGELSPDGAARVAGLLPGDRVLQIDQQVVLDGAQLRELIRASVQGARPWRIERAGQVLELPVLAAVRQESLTDADGVVRSQDVGRIGAYVGTAPVLVTVQFGPLEAVTEALRRTWEVSALTLRMIGKMLLGEASLRNLSGPLTMADYAGQSASQGWSAYLLFAALISVSLGVLNLLPVPVLDGGHLMYYLWEGVTGRRISDAWLDRLQRIGVAVLMVMMSIALFNDVVRLLA